MAGNGGTYVNNYYIFRHSEIVSASLQVDAFSACPLVAILDEYLLALSKASSTNSKAGFQVLLSSSRKAGFWKVLYIDPNDVYLMTISQ
jgi:hypothetical protein